MFDKLRRFFGETLSDDAPGRDAGTVEHSLRVATAALLVEVSRADFAVRDEERGTIVALVKRTFELDDDEARELLTMGEREADDAIALRPYTRLLNEHTTPEHRRRVVELLWEVAYADGIKDKHEEHLIRRIAELLHVSHDDFIAARQKVEHARRTARGS
jgi:uncharacterized tellurite resistance protein B-like protein